jgi:4-amino-4-deoxy-L-arabinose transferase-like glycosyltransferase
VKKYSALLLAILLALLGIFSRFLFLGSIPAELHRDETSIAYNAYSLLKTGRDEHGKNWPISFQAFGDYKLPGSIYLSIPSIYFFGLNAFALRFPNALFGFLLIPAVFFLAKQMEPKNRIFAWLAAFFTATSPLFIHAARNSYEPAIAIFFEVMAMNFLLLSRKKFAFFFAFLTMSFLASFIYHSAVLALPFFAIAVLFLYRRDFWQKAKRKFFGLGIFLYVVSLLLNLSLVSSVNQSRTNTTLFQSEEITTRVQAQVEQYHASGLPLLLSRLIANKVTLACWDFVENYLASFDPNFLFFKGDHNPWHNLENIQFGNLLFPIAFAIGLFIFRLIKKKQTLSQIEQLLLVYLVSSPLMSAFTIDAPINNRLFHFHLALILCAAYGLTVLWKLPKLWRRISLFAFFSLYLASFTLFSFRYFFLFNKNLSSAWNPGLKELNQEISHYKQSYQKIYVAEIPLAYSYFSVYQKFSPNDFQKNAQWKQEGFHEVEEFENFRFEPLPNFYQFSELNIPLYLHPGQTRILAVQAYNQELYQFVESQVVFQVKNFEGKTLWFAYEWTPQQLSEKIDTLWPKSKTKTSTLDYLQSLNSPADK